MQDIHQQIRSRMVGLVQSSVSREDVADWALALIKNESAAYSSNATLWTALDRLAGADLQTGPGIYLHGEEDFRAWVADLDA
ncbi:hypothetical protein AB0M20_06520 [Actinoplanes sp. NPDC051633]|uniref:hypothetical protein n=1 Tax=Actinoplanes sp. NPDC051633 TaxID=3155670 RepID=UPI00341E1E88